MSAENLAQIKGGRFLPLVLLDPLQDCLGTLEQLATGTANLTVGATSDPTKAPRVRVLFEELLMSLQQCENDLGIYSLGPVDL